MSPLVAGFVTEARRQVFGRWRWPVWWVLPAVAGLLTGLIMVALAGAALDDAEIDAHTGHATAQVLAVTSLRTLVQFARPDGRVYRPEAGLAYPSGLQVGQLVRVEYDRADPDRVRIAGRSWRRGVAPACVTVLALWALVAPATWWSRRHEGPGHVRGHVRGHVAVR
ncbi:MAG: DUF3592 domain-containing protein [Pseudonocardiaceae bacterium]